MAAKNVYANINELIKDYYSQPVADYLNQTVTINEVSLDCDIYRVNNNSELTAAVFTGCIAEDANTQIIIGSNLSVANGTTLIPPYRCKGIIIGCPGTFTNAGIISMTARGASGAGKNIQLTDDYMISAVGGTGGAGVDTSTGGSGRGVDGLSGNSPSTGIISCGGGGSGAGYRANNSPTTGAGGNGTSFSGGAGGGAAIGSTAGGTNGSSTGGAGGNGVTYNGDYMVTCGAGNPRGSSMHSSTVVPATDSYIQFDEEGTGTGGLIVILSNFFINEGTIKAEGSKARGINSTSAFHQSTGGSSGGGCVCIISVTSDNTGTISTAGGVTATNTMTSPGSGKYAEYGGAGGAGTYANLTVEDLVLVDPTELQLGLTVKSALDNIEPVSGRLMGLIDDDELMYEYQGTRHRAMNTDVDLSVIHAPGTAGQVDGHIYSTDEHIVGKWIDGKTLYEKTITITIPDYNGGSVVSESDFLVTNELVDTYFIVQSTMQQSVLQIILEVDESTYFIKGCRAFPRIVDNKLYIRIQNAFSAWNGQSHKMTIQYTKATDTV